MNEKLSQPTKDLKNALDDILYASPEEVESGGRAFKIGWLRHGTMRKFSHILLKEEDGFKRNIKLASVLLLNHWYLRLLYPIYWRYNYYVRELTQADALCIINAAKKKLPQDAYLMATMLATGMSDVMMTIRKAEA